MPEAAGDRTEAAYLANEAGGDGAGIGREVLSGGDGAGTGRGPLSGAGGAGAGREPLTGGAGVCAGREALLREAERLQAELKKAGERYAALARGKKNWEKALLEQQRQEKKLRAELESLWEVREREREELASLRNFLFHLKGESGEEKKQERTRRHEAEAVEKLRRERSLVIGGHPGWQKKMRDYLPGSQFLAADSRNFDTSILQNKAYIIFNTDFLLHSSYYRVMAEKKKGQKILYVHGNNPERCLSQLAGQLLPPNV